MLSCRSFYSLYFFKEFVLYHRGVLICCKEFSNHMNVLKNKSKLTFCDWRVLYLLDLMLKEGSNYRSERYPVENLYEESQENSWPIIIYYTNVLSKSHAEFKEHLKSQNVEICQCWKEFLFYRSLFLRWLTVFLVKENDQTYFLIPQTQESLTYIRDKLLWTHAIKFLKQNLRKLQTWVVNGLNFSSFLFR